MFSWDYISTGPLPNEGAALFKTHTIMGNAKEYLSVSQFRNWCRLAIQGSKLSDSTDVGSEAEMHVLLDAARVMLPYFAQHGISAKQRAAGDVMKNGFRFSLSSGAVFTFNPPSAQKKPRYVAPTSIAAYRKLDPTGQAIKVLEAGLKYTNECGWFTDNQIAQAVKIPAGRVSARRKELLEAGIIEHGNQRLQIVKTANHKCPITGFTVQAWRVEVLEGDGQIKLF